MTALSRWLAPAALVFAIGAGALVAPAPARAHDPLIRVVVDLGDVVFHAGRPYYRYGRYGDDDRLIVERDRFGRPVYYRYVDRDDDGYRAGPPYGHAYGYRRHHDRYAYGRERCDRWGRCRIDYGPGYGRGYDRDDDRDHDRRHWRDDD